MTDILKSGEKFAKLEGAKAADEQKHHSTSVTFAGDKPQDGPGSVTIGVKHEHQGEHVTVSAEGWFRRVFRPGGSSAGVKGEVKF